MEIAINRLQSLFMTAGQSIDACITVNERLPEETRNKEYLSQYILHYLKVCSHKPHLYIHSDEMNILDKIC